MTERTREAEAEDFWRNVYAAPFVQRDVRAYAAAFTLPCMIRAENLPRQSFTTREALEAYCETMIAIAFEAQWSKSVIDQFDVRVLDDDVATVAVVASRFDENDTLTARLYGSYTLNRENGAWKMASIFGGYLR